MTLHGLDGNNAPVQGRKYRESMAVILASEMFEIEHDETILPVLERLSAQDEDPVLKQRAQLRLNRMKQSLSVRKEDYEQYRKVLAESIAAWLKYKPAADWKSYAPYLQDLVQAYRALQKPRLQEGQKVKGMPWIEQQYVDELREKLYEAMNDDLNTPIVISNLFDACRVVNTLIDKKASIKPEVAEALLQLFSTFTFDILGLKEDTGNSNKAREDAFGAVVNMLLEQRQQAKAEKNWALSDKIRDDLAALGFEVKDTKDGFSWSLNV
jgi:cysteinyl-tRNA synthetase